MLEYKYEMIKEAIMTLVSKRKTVNQPKDLSSLSAMHATSENVVLNFTLQTRLMQQTDAGTSMTKNPGLLIYIFLQLYFRVLGLITIRRYYPGCQEQRS